MKQKSLKPESTTKGLPWSTEEHMQFLKGLAALGRGNWKQISRFYVPSRTPTQVASHAQKFQNRQTGKSASKRKSRFTAIEQVVFEELDNQQAAGSLEEDEAATDDEGPFPEQGPATAPQMAPQGPPLLYAFPQGPQGGFLPPTLVVCPAFSAPLPQAHAARPHSAPAPLSTLHGSFNSLPTLAQAPSPTSSVERDGQPSSAGYLRLSESPSTPWAAQGGLHSAFHPVASNGAAARHQLDVVRPKPLRVSADNDAWAAWTLQLLSGASKKGPGTSAQTGVFAANRIGFGQPSHNGAAALAIF